MLENMKAIEKEEKVVKVEATPGKRGKPASNVVEKKKAKRPRGPGAGNLDKAMSGDTNDMKLKAGGALVDSKSTGNKCEAERPKRRRATKNDVVALENPVKNLLTQKLTYTTDSGDEAF